MESIAQSIRRVGARNGEIIERVGAIVDKHVGIRLLMRRK